MSLASSQESSVQPTPSSQSASIVHSGGSVVVVVVDGNVVVGVGGNVVVGVGGNVVVVVGGNVVVGVGGSVVVGVGGNVVVVVGGNVVVVVGGNVVVVVGGNVVVGVGGSVVVVVGGNVVVVAAAGSNCPLTVVGVGSVPPVAGQLLFRLLSNVGTFEVVQPGWVLALISVILLEPVGSPSELAFSTACILAVVPAPLPVYLLLCQCQPKDYRILLYHRDSSFRSPPRRDTVHMSHCYPM
jgi:hypothetical protein